MPQTTENLLSKLRAAVLQLRFLPRGMRLVWDAAPGWTILWGSVLLAQALLPVAIVYLTREVVDQLTAVREAGFGGAGGILLPACLIALVLLGIEVLRIVSTYVGTVHGQILQDHVHARVHEQAVAIVSYLLTSRETAAELRMFDLGGTFQAYFCGLRQGLRQGERRLAKHHLIAETVAATTVLLLAGSVMAWMVWGTFRGLLTLGELALFYQAFNQGQKLMHSLFQQAGQVYYNSLFLGNLFEYLDLRPQVVTPAQPRTSPREIRRGLCFENVSFCYPGSERRVLQGLDLEIPAYTKVAIVGPNGAGKTTLIKLLLRFYDPTFGRITLDGTDLREFSTADLRRAVTVLFQQPVQYNATVRENITWGDPAIEHDITDLEQAARAAGLESIVESFPQGYDELLGKWFRGGTHVLEHGHLVESGNHRGLIETSGRYAAGWSSQMRSATMLSEAGTR